MSNTYCVKVFVGPYNWTCRDTDAAAYGLADPLTITWSLPDSDLQPLVQPNPTTASFTVVVATYGTISAMELGQQVSIRYWSATSPAAGDAPLFDFNGRVVDLSIRPHDLGLSITVSCVDYLADISERTVGLVNWPQETVDARARRILTEAGVSIPADLWETDVDPSSPATIAARNASDVNALDVLTHTLDQYLTVFAGFPNANGRGFIHQVTTPAAPTFSSGISSKDFTNGPYVLGSVTKAIAYDPPLRMVNLAGVHTLQGDAAAATASTAVIDASYIERDVSWQQRKGTAVNAVQVTGAYTPAQTRTWSGISNTFVWANVDGELVNASDGLALAGLYLPAMKPTNQRIWTAETFTWRIGRDPSTTWRLPVLGRVLAIYDIDTRWRVTGDSWWVGMPTAVTFTLAGGDPQATLTVMPWLVDPVQAISPLTLADAGWGSITIDSLAAADTFDDYQLAKGPAA